MVGTISTALGGWHEETVKRNDLCESKGEMCRRGISSAADSHAVSRMAVGETKQIDVARRAGAVLGEGQ